MRTVFGSHEASAPYHYQRRVWVAKCNAKDTVVHEVESVDDAVRILAEEAKSAA